MAKWPVMQAGHNQPGARLGVCWLRVEAAKADIQKVHSFRLISTTDKTTTSKRRVALTCPLPLLLLQGQPACFLGSTPVFQKTRPPLNWYYIKKCPRGSDVCPRPPWGGHPVSAGPGSDAGPPSYPLPLLLQDQPVCPVLPCPF